jgi:E3 ubiquitin-protein ligase DOA10
MGWATSFIFLYTALYLFERKRVKLDWFQVLVVALVPALIYTLKIFIQMLIALPPIVDAIIWLTTYPIVFLLLWKMMGITRARSVGYTVGLFVFDMALVTLVASIAGGP